MSRVAGASSDARATAADVKALADTLAAEAESLDGEVRRSLPTSRRLSLVSMIFPRPALDGADEIHARRVASHTPAPSPPCR